MPPTIQEMTVRNSSMVRSNTLFAQCLPIVTDDQKIHNLKLEIDISWKGNTVNRSAKDGK